MPLSILMLKYLAFPAITLLTVCPSAKEETQIN